MSSSRCILNMKRLVTLKYKQMKTSKKQVQKATWKFVDDISLNSRDKAEALECWKSHHWMDCVPEEWNWNKV